MAEGATLAYCTLRLGQVQYHCFQPKQNFSWVWSNLLLVVKGCISCFKSDCGKALVGPGAVEIKSYTINVLLSIEILSH